MWVTAYLFVGYSLFSNFYFNLTHKKVRTLAAQRKMYSILSHLVIHWIYLSVAFSIILGVFLWLTICYLKSSVFSVTYINSSMLSLRRKQFNLLIYGQGSIKNMVVCQNNFFLSILRVDNLERKFFFSLNKTKKSVFFSVQSINSLCNKIEEHSWRIIRNSNQNIFALLYNNLGFSVCCLNILQIKN